MSICARSNSQGNFGMRKGVSLDKVVKNRGVNLISLPKDMYALFNQFQLAQSRLSSIKEYQYLVQQMRRFNLQLKLWKQKNGPSIRNLRMTYFFYQNLYSRIRFVNELSPDKQAAKNSLIQVMKWFTEEKPKIRGAPRKRPQPLLKQYQQNAEQRLQLDDMNQFAIRKRDMKPYQKMARTSHPNFFPPKQRLLDYQKKQFILDFKLTIDPSQTPQVRLGRTASRRQRTDEQKLRQTSTTFQHTKSTFKNNTTDRSSNKQSSSIIPLQPTNTAHTSNTAQPSDNIYPSNTVHPSYTVRASNGTVQIEEQKQAQSQQQKNVSIKEFVLDQDEKDKRMRKDQIVLGLIVQPKYQEDQQDYPQNQLIQEQDDKEYFKKSYKTDHKYSSQIAAVQQMNKDQQQSTLRRILRIKQEQMQHKLEDLNIRDQMGEWAKTKSFINEQINRKSQSYRCMNEFHRTQYRKKGFFQKRKQIPQFQLKTHRSKTVEISQLRRIQQTCEERKVDNALKNFGKYIITHVRIDSGSRQDQQNQGARVMRATSLTAFNKKSRKKQLGQILAQNQTDAYNQQINTQVINIKQKLSKKLIGIDKEKIYSALCAVKTERFGQNNAFPRTVSLISNPFFPKHLYEAKKKKKK